MDFLASIRCVCLRSHGVRVALEVGSFLPKHDANSFRLLLEYKIATWIVSLRWSRCDVESKVYMRADSSEMFVGVEPTKSARG